VRVEKGLWCAAWRGREWAAGGQELRETYDKVAGVQGLWPYGGKTKKASDFNGIKEKKWGGVGPTGGKSRVYRNLPKVGPEGETYQAAKRARPALTSGLFRWWRLWGGKKTSPWEGKRKIKM